MLYVPNIILEPDPADGLISRACMVRYILKLMAEDYSQTCHFVSWTGEMADSLWDDVNGQPQESAFSQTNLSDEDRKLFLDLATVAGGWWIDFHEPDGFLPLSDWQHHLDQRSAS